MIDNILTITFTLFSIIDIVGSIPIILNLRKKYKKLYSLKTTIISTIIMLSFLFVGTKLLILFGLDIKSFSIAGSLIIFLIGLEMVLNVEIFKSHPNKKESLFVPLIFPLIAGPGVLTSIISFKSLYSVTEIITSIIINMFFVFIVLKNTEKVEKILGGGGIALLEKLFGFILLAISIKMFINGISL